jgi:hypothetical protein
MPAGRGKANDSAGTNPPTPLHRVPRAPPTQSREFSAVVLEPGRPIDRGLGQDRRAALSHLGDAGGRLRSALDPPAGRPRQRPSRVVAQRTLDRVQVRHEGQLVLAGISSCLRHDLAVGMPYLPRAGSPPPWPAFAAAPNPRRRRRSHERARDAFNNLFMSWVQPWRP